MFPLPDENPTRILAWVTLAFIEANTLVHSGLQLAEQGAMLDTHAALTWEMATGQPLGSPQRLLGP